MSYEKRIDGRKDFTELRALEGKTGVIKRADGSAFFKIGDTIAYAAVYGPRELYPRFLQDPKKGILRCHYNMMPFSGHGDRVRPGPNRRAKEISMITEKALLPVVDLSDFPNSVVDVFVEFPQTDAGSRCAGITAASMALADAGILMKDMVSSVAVGRVDDKLVADLNYDEEAHEGGRGTADMPVAMLANSGELTLLQLDGEIKREEINECIKIAKESCSKIYEVQKKALKDRYVGE